MKLTHKLLAAAALLGTPAVAGSASAQSYDITFGSALTAHITTAPSTGSNLAITSISGTFLGSAITGIVANPYSPATAYVYDSTGVVQPTAIFPAGQTGTQQYYEFDNLLINGNTFDSNGLLFRTSSDTINLYNSGGFALIYSPTGVNVAASAVAGTFSITQSAAVPEAATWAMMILGMGAVGFAMRRQKATARVSYAA